jgi:hypothetical protein
MISSTVPDFQWSFSKNCSYSPPSLWVNKPQGKIKGKS